MTTEAPSRLGTIASNSRNRRSLVSHVPIGIFEARSRLQDVFGSQRILLLRVLLARHRLEPTATRKSCTWPRAAYASSVTSCASSSPALKTQSANSRRRMTKVLGCDTSRACERNPLVLNPLSALSVYRGPGGLRQGPALLQNRRPLSEAEKKGVDKWDCWHRIAACLGTAGRGRD
jgi:hypothetical protein